MFHSEDALIWTATDLAAAASCEYAVLAGLDLLLGRAERAPAPPDPLRDQVVELGARHEHAELLRLRELHGQFDPSAGTGVREFTRVRSADTATLRAAAAVTAEALEMGADVLYQPLFFDGDFHGYADFLRRTPEGWVVCDTKLARHEKPTALLQLAAYADQLVAAGAQVAPTVELVLGNGARSEFRRSDLEPVFRERRERLQDLLGRHQKSGAPARWGSDEVLACGSCPACASASAEARDLVLVAGLRMEQRRRLRAQGIETIDDLAAATDRPPGMAESTFLRLRDQARLQVRQVEPAPGEELVVHHEVISEEALQALPEKSAGDLFFDFEGDPLHNEGDPADWGLEYLWGVLTALDHPEQPHEFLPLWADDHRAEREQLVEFLDDLTVRLAVHPDLHVYHYAPYEVTALKRLTAKHKTHEAVLDDLLRRGVFVDLYAVVRAGILISQPSYSIKKLEPLYMPAARTGEVTQGDASIAAYHSYALAREHGEREEAAQHRKALLDYNQVDCESTLRLRDWLFDLVDRPVPDPEGASPVDVSTDAEPDEEHDELAVSLQARSGPVARVERTADEQGWAMLASALGYHRRERLPEAWAYFHRLFTPPGEWADGPDVLVFSAPPEVLTAWEKQPRKRTFSRRLRGIAQVGPGNTVRGGDMSALYADPLPDGVEVVDRALHAVGCNATVLELEELDEGRIAVVLEERLKVGQLGHAQLPVALVPGYGVNSRPLEEAVREVASAADASGSLDGQPALELLTRSAPRLRSLGALPATGDIRADMVAALRDLDGSYLAVQGPPGTGKTWTGSRVIRDLVEQHGWRVGVVGQSHAVVENFLRAVVGAGVPAERVGKKETKSTDPTWTTVKDPGAFVAAQEGGCVVGGTAWNFVAQGFERGSLDLLVVDEAGQFSLANTLAVSVAAPRLLLLGDPQQLPQVSQGTHGEPVDRSALGWLMDGDAALPPGLGYFLGDSYRMHPEVCAPVSRLSYDGRLHAAAPAAERDLAGIEPGVVVVELPHLGRSVACPEEADEVVRQVQRLIGTPWRESADAAPRPLDASDFLVVAPYNAQRQLLGRRLEEAGLGEVRVGTVDKFQGQEAPVVLVSMTASSRADVPRGMGFLLNRNRINVAVSRAQWLAVVVRSRSLTSFMPRTVDGLLELGAFIGLCRDARR